MMTLNFLAMVFLLGTQLGTGHCRATPGQHLDGLINVLQQSEKKL
jgi:hypothetical protein